MSIMGFNSWEGFEKAGFDAVTEDMLLSGNEALRCEVHRGKKEHRVKMRLPRDGGEVLEWEFPFPEQVPSFPYWAALFAYGAAGEKAKYKAIFDEEADGMPQALLDLIEFGMGHEDELPIDLKDKEVADEDALDGEEANGEELPVGDMSGDAVASQIAKIGELLSKVHAKAWKAAQDATANMDLAASRKYIGDVAKLKEMIESAAALGEAWKSLGLEGLDSEAEADTAEEQGDGEGLDGFSDEVPEDEFPPEPQEPDEPPTPRGRCTNFAVTLPDGVRIAESKASVTFAKTIEKLGAERVAGLGLRMAGDPIVAQDRAEIKKMPTMVQPIAGGWFVKTHSNTYTKMQFLRNIAESLGIELKFELFRKEEIKTGKRKGGKRHKKLPRKPKPRPKPKPENPFPRGFKISRVVQEYFPRLFAEADVTDQDVAYLLSAKCQRDFGVRGYRVLMETDGKSDDYKINGYNRYYSDIILTHFRRKYRLTSQFITSLCEPVLKWLEAKGFDREEMIRIGCGPEDKTPSLFDSLDLFAPSKSAGAKPDSAQEASLTGRPTVAVGTQAAFPIAASDIRAALRREMKIHSYTPSTLAAGLRFPRRLVKGWFKGRGVLTKEQYDAICHHMGIKGLK